MIRRQVLLGIAAAGAMGPIVSACSSQAQSSEFARKLRRPLAEAAGSDRLLQLEMVRYATLAPSSHNTQCWTFHLQDRAIVIAPDITRRCPAVDPDDHHLFVSLGCSTENLAHAALASGMQADAHFNEQGQGSIEVNLTATRPIKSPLFEAISSRQCTRGDYDGKPLTTDELRQLEAAGTGNGVRVILLTGRRPLENVLEYVIEGNSAQIGDPRFVAELTAWIRFNAADAIRTGDGLFTGATGNPELPGWLGKRMMGTFFTAKSENDRYVRQIRSSAGIAVFVSDANDKQHWVEAGRCYERFALQATALGIRNAMINQPVEVAAIRPRFAATLGIGNQRPDMVARFGRGPEMPMSMRRPVEAVLV